MVQQSKTVSAWTNAEKISRCLELFYRHRDAWLLETLNLQVLETVAPHLTGADEALCRHYMLRHHNQGMTVAKWKEQEKKTK